MAAFTTPDNKAAWIVAEKQSPLEVKPGPDHKPEANEVVIKVAYAAVNPTDWRMQDNPYIELPYPWVFGTDVAGTIVAVGSEATRFNIGQRVIAHCNSLLSRKVTNAGFQSYSTCDEILVAAVPDSLPLVNAAVLPLSISTAAAGLFGHLNLPFPTLNPTASGKTVLIWGGSSSCGSSAIQLAISAGYKVATTAGDANHKYVKDLGADFVFSHSDPKVVENILHLFEKEKFGGILDCIADHNTQNLCADILSKLGGGVLPTLLWPSQEFPKNVDAKLVMGLDPAFGRRDIGDAVWRNFIPQALAAGKFQAKPDPLLLVGGLEKVQEGINIQRNGVSAKKVVIEVVATK
ncbi:zinc-binding oxidoreductase [Phlyctema vagabunda]|uniref:Zinc-binding oxidoreductase n=1 Tax=Phlyctema vagabunda TaxID=108571 RepID=A0ABR4P1C3_9HELO